VSATDSASASLPLAGVSVLVTRTAEQSDALAGPLRALGAEVIALPVIEVADPLDTTALDVALADIRSYGWVVLTSTNGVDRFFERLRTQHAPEDVLDGVRFAVVGSATAKRLVARGCQPDLIPEDFRAEGLVDAFRATGVAGTRILIPRAAEAREVLPEQLATLGAHVDAVDLYRLVPAPADPAVLARIAEGGVQVAAFASGATARHFMALLTANGLDARAIMRSLTIASVGPVTTAGIKKLGFEAQIEAAASTMDALVEAIAAHFGS